MLVFTVAQDATTVPDAVVVEVVEQATKAIDTFNNLGVFMAVLLVFSLFVIVILLLVWSNRKTGQTALDVVSISNADKIREIQEMREERRQEVAVERLRQQANHDQFMTALTLLAGKQTDIVSGVTSSESRVKEQVIASGTDVISHVERSKDEIITVVRLLAKVNMGIFKPAGSEPPDFATMQLILEETDKAIEAAQARAEALAAQIAATPADAGESSELDELPKASGM